jgi:hypothetical protein
LQALPAANVQHVPGGNLHASVIQATISEVSSPVVQKKLETEARRVMETKPEANEAAPNDLLAVAYHEAGHAVMAIALGRPVQKVTIVAGRSQRGVQRLGACQIKKGRLRDSKDWLEDEVLILFAGMVAEARVTGDYCLQHASDDLRCVRRYVQMRADGERQIERLEKRLLSKTENLLESDEYWRAIELIANELIRAHTLSGRAAHHFFELAQVE